MMEIFKIKVPKCPNSKNMDMDEPEHPRKKQNKDETAGVSKITPIGETQISNASHNNISLASRQIIQQLAFPNLVWSHECQQFL